MADFANNFPDAQVYSQLGDRIEVVEANGQKRYINAVFDYEYEEDELGDRLSVKIPYINCPNDVAKTLNNTQVLRYNGESYSIFNRNPVDTGVTQLILRSVRSI